MILIPYFWDRTNEYWIRFGVFLCSGGRQYWSVDDTDTDEQIKEMLYTNGFPVLELWHTPVGIFGEIDYEKMNLSTFYLWSEIEPKKSEEDIWRIYKIPKVLWSDPVFKEHWWITSGILPLSDYSENLIN
jgi:hypothetical protein